MVGGSVCQVVKAFIHSGISLSEINHTFITLIPKINEPKSTNYFRPISLYSTIYKIIFKVRNNRLQEFLGRIIHPLKGAFVPEILILDNILIAHVVFIAFKIKEGRMDR